VSFVAGTNATYFLDVNNAGPSDEGPGIVVTDTLPTGETFVSAGAVGWSCAAASAVVTCTYAPALVNGASAPTIDLVVALASSVGPSIVNTASVTGTNVDPNLVNNTASDTATVMQQYDLSLTKTLAGGLVSGDSAVYTITVTNSGPSDSAMPLTVVDDLPTGLAYEGATSTTPGTWQCVALGKAISCTDSTVPLVSGATSAILVATRVMAGAGAHVTNVASISGPGDTGAPGETGAVDGLVASAPSDPNTGSGVPLALFPGILLVLLGLGLTFFGQRRRRLLR
jgi:large repetitive protein